MHYPPSALAVHLTLVKLLLKALAQVQIAGSSATRLPAEAKRVQTGPESPSAAEKQAVAEATVPELLAAPGHGGDPAATCGDATVASPAAVPVTAARRSPRATTRNGVRRLIPRERAD